jgi:hypothetical protein
MMFEGCLRHSCDWNARKAMQAGAKNHGNVDAGNAAKREDGKLTVSSVN